MHGWTYLLAWALPMFAGTAVWRLVARGARRRGDWAATLGGGWILGVFLAAWLARWLAVADTAHAFGHAAPWLAGVGVLAWLILGWRRLRDPRPWAIATETPMRSWARGLWWVLVALVAWRLAALGSEALLRPVFPWDAWSAWSLKPKAWFLLGHAAPYVSAQRWLAEPARDLLTASSWNYPELLAWIELWFASALGGWNEPLIDVVWCGALGALLLGAYGQWRALGVRAPLAMALVYALASLPLLDAHVALAGYADLWVAVTLGLATLAWMRWLAWREPGGWLLVIVLALWLPSLKLEGGVWAAVLALMLVFGLVPSRWRLAAAGGGLAVLAGALLQGDALLHRVGIDAVHIGLDGIRIPGLPALTFSWHPVGGSIAAGLFALPNWHLVWYLLPLLVAWRWRQFLHDQVARQGGALIVIFLALLFVLFFLTGAAAWAADYTSANRLVLQIVPAVFAFAAALLRAPPTPESPDRVTAGG
jgi:hypothetical protein